MNAKIDHSVKNLANAVAKLQEFLTEEVKNDRDRAGIIQGFEFTYELLWKTLQKIAISEGLQVGSPKAAFKAALQLDLVKPEEEDAALKLIEDRNQTSHTYKRQTADEILGRIRAQHFGFFQTVLSRIQKRD